MPVACNPEHCAELSESAKPLKAVAAGLHPSLQPKRELETLNPKPQALNPPNPKPQNAFSILNQTPNPKPVRLWKPWMSTKPCSSRASRRQGNKAAQALSLMDVHSNLELLVTAPHSPTGLASVLGELAVYRCTTPSFLRVSCNFVCFVIIGGGLRMPEPSVAVPLCGHLVSWWKDFLGSRAT